MKSKAMEQLKGQENKYYENQNFGKCQRQWIKVEV